MHAVTKPKPNSEAASETTGAGTGQERAGWGRRGRGYKPRKMCQDLWEESEEKGGNRRGEMWEFAWLYIFEEIAVLCLLQCGTSGGCNSFFSARVQRKKGE